MSAEVLVETIIDNAIAIAQSKADEAASYSSQAITASSGFATMNPNLIAFEPANVEPPMNIPRTATGVDGALYGTTYDQIIHDLSDSFARFFVDYFPNECDYLEKAQAQLCEILNGGTGIPAHVEDQIWQRDRARVLNEVQRATDETLATFAARGFAVPPGAATHAIYLNQVESQNKIAQQSRDVAIKHVEILMENIRFAIQNALDYRIKAIQAAGDYIKTLAVGPEIAVRLATSAANAQAQLISAASSYYRNRIAVEELKLDVHKFNAGTKNEIGMTELREFSNRLKARADVLASAAQAAGNQAASALNAVHASAGVAVQGETA